MELRLIYPRWGSGHVAWPEFLKKVKTNKYYGVETHLPLSGKEKEETLNELKNFNLKFIGQHYETKEVDFEKHKESLKRHLYNLAESQPFIVNSHTGMDFFSFSQNAELIELAHLIEQDTGIPITHETHRSRFCFAAHICLPYLEEFPFLKLTGDFAHWTCVAESLLENQKEAIETAMKRTLHLHARVGSSQSSQVIDPRDKMYQQELKQFKIWWRYIMNNAINIGRTFLTVMPEHGPHPYSLCQPYTMKPLADQWEVNQFIKTEILKVWKDINSNP